MGEQNDLLSHKSNEETTNGPRSQRADLYDHKWD